MDVARKKRSRRVRQGRDVETDRKGSVGEVLSRLTTGRQGLLIAAVTGALIVIVIVAALQSGPRDPAAFAFEAYQGEDTLGASSLKFQDVLDQGRPVVLNFWGGDCPPCRAEMPAIQSVYERTGNEVLFLGMDVGEYLGLGTRDSAVALLDELGVTYPAGVPLGVDAVRGYSVTSLPMTIFFTSNGEPLTNWPGAINEDQLADIVERLRNAS